MKTAYRAFTVKRRRCAKGQLANLAKPSEIAYLDRMAALLGG